MLGGNKGLLKSKDRNRDLILFLLIMFLKLKNTTVNACSQAMPSVHFYHQTMW